MFDKLDALLSQNAFKPTESIVKKTFIVNKKNVFDLLNKEDYVGEVFQINYNEVKVQINDYNRRMVGGVPALSFLLATRINPDIDKNFNEEDFQEEDNCVILLRVLDSCFLPETSEIEKITLLLSKKSNNHENHWDNELSDPTLKSNMSYGGLKCSVIGTFYMDKDKSGYKLEFGNDLSNFYPHKALKVYKPKLEQLEMIVNFGINPKSSVHLGKVRYASSNRFLNQKENISNVYIDPNDLVAQRTALFGMTRTGKSNTVKMILKTIYQLRQKEDKKIGQLIFDVNGEYANDNMQDKNSEGEAQSLKNVWMEKVDGVSGLPEDVVIYSMVNHNQDPNRRVMKFNFLDDLLLAEGKSLLNSHLELDPTASALYTKNFINVEFDNTYLSDTSQVDYSERTRESRVRLIYKTILVNALFKPKKSNNKVLLEGLFNKKLLQALEEGFSNFRMLSESAQNDISSKKKKYSDCASTLHKLSSTGVTYQELIIAFEALNDFISNPKSSYSEFNSLYMQENDGNKWADVRLESLLGVFAYSNFFKKLQKYSVYHSAEGYAKDYIDMIYDDLLAGKLIIVDQSLGESDLNKVASERIVKKIFSKNNEQFATGQTPCPVLLYIEEAHNLLPNDMKEDNLNIWARIAKEGAKFNIGMVYSTQEVSSIQKNILSNTSNWFIAHLNNTKEIKAISEFYDFADFADSIKKTEDKGFIRMKTKSNKFIVPIQVNKFDMKNN